MRPLFSRLAGPASHLARLARRSSRDGPALAALILVAAYAGAALCLVAPASLERVVEAAAHARETELAASNRLFGPDFAVSIESIRQALAEGEPYLLVDGGEPWEGGPYWVRFALAPRAAVFLGRLGQVRPGHSRWQRFEQETLPHLVVANNQFEGPDLYERQEYLEMFAPTPPTPPGHGP